MKLHYTARLSNFFVSIFCVALLAAAIILPHTNIVRADNEDVITPDALSGGEAEVATSTDGTGGKSSDTGGSITTGDATASTSVENGLNYNNVSPDVAGDSHCTNPDDNSEDQQGWQGGIIAEGGPQCSDGEDNDNDGFIDYPGLTSSGFTATSTNDATLGSDSEALAGTGQNTTDGGQATTTIDTGNAVAAANVINLANTNIFNSIGLMLFINQIFGVGFDLRNFNLNYFFDGEAGASPTVDEDGQPQCTLLTCLDASSEEIVNNNTANVSNTVLVHAATGENLASTTGEGGAYIQSGDAYAAANVVNVVNTNIINSSYLMVAFNNFGNLSGDITLPDANFFDRLFENGGTVPAMNASSYKATNTHNLDFVGTTTATADTGDNTASTTGEGSGEVATGNAYSAASTFTDANQNYIGGTSVFFLFRTWGAWNGTIKGLPAGMTAILSPGGIIVTSDPDGILSEALSAECDQEEGVSNCEMAPESPESGVVASEADPEAPAANCDEEDGPKSNCFNASSFLASSTNTATVENNVEVIAETGGNHAATENGTAGVTTGDAYAVANIVNLINTNIIGRNWIFAVFNVFGDWDGNISFGKSELKLEAAADAPSPARPGSTVLYRFTVTNNGDADAEGVLLNASFDKNLLAFEGDEGASDTDTGRRWTLGDVPRGESRTFTFSARVGSIPSGALMTVPLTATLSADGDEGQSVLFTVAAIDAAASDVPASGGGSKKSKGSQKKSQTTQAPEKSNKAPDLTVVKSVTASTLNGTTTLNYKVVVQNGKEGGPLYNAVLTDTLYNPMGEEEYTRSWALETVAPADQITLTYSVEFAASSTPGTYRNVARVTGNKLSPQGVQIAPVEGAATVQLGQGGLVLGVATEAPASSCSAPFLTTYLSRGGVNPPAQVIKLQGFLNTQGAALPLTGLFGPMTELAVRNFQRTHAADILTPLGLTMPTGSVYASTQRQINKLACGGDLSFAPVVPQYQAAAPLYRAPAVMAPAPKPAAPAPAPTPSAPTASSSIVGWFTGLFR